jgi:IclR family KDG regulon transcriptional repressor
MTEGAEGRRRDQSQTVERALQLLDAVATSAEPLTTGQLATLSGLARPTAHRLLVTLERQGYLDRVRDHAFALGYKATRMSGNRAAQQALARRARPILEILTEQVRETVGLSTPVGTALVEIDQIDPPQPIRQMSYANAAFPLHCSSNGKLMLSGFSPAELDVHLAHPLERRTDHSITDPTRLRAELAATRERGFGLCVEELYEGINGVSGAILDSQQLAIGYVSVSGPAFSLPVERLTEIAPTVLGVCEQIKEALQLTRP